MLETIADDFGLANVGKVVTRVWVDAEEEVDPRALRLFASEQVVDLGARSGQSLA